MFPIGKAMGSGHDGFRRTRRDKGVAYGLNINLGGYVYGSLRAAYGGIVMERFRRASWQTMAISATPLERAMQSIKALNVES